MQVRQEWNRLVLHNGQRVSTERQQQQSPLILSESSVRDSRVYGVCHGGRCYRHVVANLITSTLSRCVVVKFNGSRFNALFSSAAATR